MPKANPINQCDENDFVSESDLAEHWDISGRTLQRWRSLGQGPKFVYIGRLVRYRIRDILHHEAERQGDKGGKT